MTFREHWYRPDGSGPISVGAFLAEGHRFGREASVAQWEGEVAGQHVHVSTVFLGLDHCYTGGEPLIYESMVFGGTFDQSVRRYPSRTAAEAGHEELVSIVQLDAAYAQEEPKS